MLYDQIAQYQTLLMVQIIVQLNANLLLQSDDFPKLTCIFYNSFKMGPQNISTLNNLW